MRDGWDLLGFRLRIGTEGWHCLLSRQQLREKIPKALEAAHVVCFGSSLSGPWHGKGEMGPVNSIPFTWPQIAIKSAEKKPSQALRG